MMSNELSVVPAWFFKSETEHQGLLGPVTRLQEIVGLEKSLVSTVRKCLVHAGGVEIPDWGAVHDIQAIGAKDTEIQGGVGLLHEAIFFRAGAEFEPAGEGPEDALHGEFAGEGEDNDVEGDESKVFKAFAIVNRCFRVTSDGGGDQGVGG